MIRLARAFISLSIAVLLSLCAIPSHADQVVAPIDVQYHQVFAAGNGGCAYPSGFDGTNTLQYLQLNFKNAATANCAGIASYSTGAVTYVPASYTIHCTDSSTGADCSFTIQSQLTPVCPSGSSYNASTGGCDADGPCNKSLGDPGPGYTKDFGTNETAARAALGTPAVACLNNCSYAANGDVNLYKYMKDGVVNWYIGVPNSLATGGSCGSDSTVSTQAPQNTCPTGQTAATVNGESACFNADGSKASGTNSGPASACGDTFDVSDVTNGDGSRTRTTTTTDTCSGKQTTSTQNFPADTTPPSVPNSGFVPKGSSAPPGVIIPNASTNDPTTGQPTGSTGDYCAKNPNALMCLQKQTDTLPGDPDTSGFGSFGDAFFNGTFSDLQAWRIPAHSGVCPTYTFDFTDLFGGTLLLNEHCAFADSIRTDYGNVMIVVWLLIALFIVLGA